MWCLLPHVCLPLLLALCPSSFHPLPMQTTASTLAAVVATPLITSWLAGTLVAVDAQGLFMSTLQVRSSAYAHAHMHRCASTHALFEFCTIALHGCACHGACIRHMHNLKFIHYIDAYICELFRQPYWYTKASLI